MVKACELVMVVDDCYRFIPPSVDRWAKRGIFTPAFFGNVCLR